MIDPLINYRYLDAAFLYWAAVSSRLISPYSWGDDAIRESVELWLMGRM